LTTQIYEKRIRYPPLIGYEAIRNFEVELSALVRTVDFEYSLSRGSGGLPLSVPSKSTWDGVVPSSGVEGTCKEAIRLRGRVVVVVSSEGGRGRKGKDDLRRVIRGEDPSSERKRMRMATVVERIEFIQAEVRIST
jgi:hypothetical protein